QLASDDYGHMRF
uniref:Sulfakinin n=2 Tax=Acrididae TaxID=7002 RepID=LOSK_LOCMI|nr:RecName: Full=Sulfakinin; Short=Lom-SK [Locusta migratoria]